MASKKKTPFSSSTDSLIDSLKLPWDVCCLLIDGLLTFFKSIIFISAATFYVGAYQITPKHLHCFTSVNDLQTLLVSDYAQVSGLQKSRRQIQRQRPVSAAILA